MRDHLRAEEAQHAVIVGASLAAVRAAETLAQQGFIGRVTVIGEEPVPPYDRPPLTKGFLAGQMKLDQLALPTAHLNVTWRLGVPASSLDLEGAAVVLADGDRIPFDGLLIATGVRARVVPGLVDGPPEAVHTLRTDSDAARLRAALRARPRRIAIVGGGWIATETAATARGVGAEVTLVSSSPVPLAPVLGNEAALMCLEEHEQHGVRLRLGQPVSRICVEASGAGHVETSDGSTEPADVILLALGSVPNTEWLRGSGLLIENGVVTDRALRGLSTAGAEPSVVVAGDVARWPHPLAVDRYLRVEHWANAKEQGAAAARSLLHHLRRRPGSPPAFQGVPTFWSDQYANTVMSVGFPAMANEPVVTRRDRDHGRLLSSFFRDQKLVGAVAINDPRRLGPLRRELTASFAP